MANFSIDSTIVLAVSFVLAMAASAAVLTPFFRVAVVEKDEPEEGLAELKSSSTALEARKNRVFDALEELDYDLHKRMYSSLLVTVKLTTY